MWPLVLCRPELKPVIQLNCFYPVHLRPTVPNVDPHVCYKTNHSFFIYKYIPATHSFFIKPYSPSFSSITMAKFFVIFLIALFAICMLQVTVSSYNENVFRSSVRY